MTPTDLEALEQILLAAGVAGPADLDQVRADGGLGLFVRSLLDIDREAAKRAFDVFLGSHTFSANQIEFLNMVIDHLTACGAMDHRLLYESPFTDLDPLGVAGLFAEAEVIELIEILDQVRRRAAA